MQSYVILALLKSRCQSVARSQVGTPLWMAPEVMNDDPYGSPADVYSFGLVLYELVSKEIPFKDKNPVHLVRLVVDQRKRPDLPLSTPLEWRSIIESCWQQQPARRYE